MRVLVTNIPVRACVNGWIEVPDNTPQDKLHDTIAASLRDRGFTPATQKIEISVEDLDTDLLEKWEFTTR